MIARLTKVVGAPGREAELEKLFYDIVGREKIEGLLEVTLLFDAQAGNYMALDVWENAELMEARAQGYQSALREGLEVAQAKAVGSDRYEIVTRWRAD